MVHIDHRAYLARRKIFQRYEVLRTIFFRARTTEKGFFSFPNTIYSGQVVPCTKISVCVIRYYVHGTFTAARPPRWVILALSVQASGFYKYNSAAREFREVHSKTLGKTTDAISMEPARLKRPKGLAMQ